MWRWTRELRPATDLPRLLRRGFRVMTRRRRQLAEARHRAPAAAHRFANVRHTCIFLGTARSGHSVAGALLDAHPDVAIAHGQHILWYVQRGLGRDELFYLMHKNAERQGKAGRRSHRFDYGIAGGWQGRSRVLTVLGDKRGDSSAKLVARDPHILSRLESTVGSVRYVQVVRNPFDAIATMARRRRRKHAVRDTDLLRALARFAHLTRAVESVRPRLGERLHTLRHEQLIASPEPTIAALCAHVGVASDPEHLRGCASILYRHPHRSRDLVTWSTTARRAVQTLIDATPTLQSYTFDTR